MEKQRKCWDSTGKNGKAWERKLEENLESMEKHGKRWENKENVEIWENVGKGGRSREKVGRSGNLNDFIL